MFNLVLLADVRQRDGGAYELSKYGVGFSMKINGLNTVITTDTHKQLGANLGMIGRSVFAANQDSLSAIKEVARFSNCVLFDAPTMMLYEDDHYLMTVRYLIWVSHTTGRVSTFVWLMDREGDTGEYRIVEPHSATAAGEYAGRSRHERDGGPIYVRHSLERRVCFGPHSAGAGREHYAASGAGGGRRVL